MRDILVRLAYSHVQCTCLTKTPEPEYHEELCLYRIIRDAESAILQLREDAETLADIKAAFPNIIAQTYRD